MLRTPHTKACLNPLRMVLLLRDAHESSSTTRTCAGTRLLLTHSCTNSLHKPKAFSLFLHTSPSQRPTSRQSYSPESSFTSSCHGVRRSTHHVLCAGGVWRAALQTRGLHRSAPRPTVTDECLSAGNEARCRRSLQANAALYGGAGTSWAAVLVCLCAVSGHPALLFTLRSAKLKGRHKGDVSFAGGKKDPSDRTVVDTALREAREELGVHVTEERVWGVLKPLRDMSGMMIAPVVANLGPLEALSFRPNPSEVEEIFTLTLEHLCQAQNRGYTHFRTGDRYGYTLPVFLSPRHRVWGLTAVALDQALRVIVPQEQLLDHSAVQ